MSRKCCFCVSLNYSAVIIGILEILFSIYIILIQKNLSFDQEALDVYVGTAWLALIPSILLIFGALLKNKCLLAPWLLIGGINLVLRFYIHAIQFKRDFQKTADASEIDGYILGFISDSAYYAFQCYFWVMVYCLYSQMCHSVKSDKKQILPIPVYSISQEVYSNPTVEVDDSHLNKY